MNLREYLEARLAESKKNKYAFTDEQAMYLEGCEAELESLLDAIKDGELVDDNYKRGVVDGMTASANDDSYKRGYIEALEAAANTALSIDSNRGNEKEIAKALRDEAIRLRDPI